MSEEKPNASTSKAAKHGFTGSAEFYFDDGEPHLNLMAYCGQADLLLETFAAGYKIRDGMLHDACCGRPTFRGYSHDGHYAHWPEAFHETVRVLIANGAEVNAKNPSGNLKYEGCKPWVTNGESPLHYAAAAWDEPIVQQPPGRIPNQRSLKFRRTSNRRRTLYDELSTTNHRGARS